jgi:tricorn protease
MPHFRCLLLLFLAVAPLGAAEPIRFGRTPDLSPDAKTVVFSYLGDLYTVEAIGGVARAITTHPAHDLNPSFSPDGQNIAFSSNRYGGYDVFVVSARGGKPRRLTFDSAADMVCGWTPDGKHILFASGRNMVYPPTLELYTVPVEGGRVQRVTRAEGKEGQFSPRGDTLAYVRGPGSWYRKHYRGSSNDEIWLANADGTNNRRLTTHNGQDHSPMWSPDGTTMFYVSDVLGTLNVVRQPVAGGTKPVALTQHTDDAVRRARISRNGDYIVYECGTDLWMVGTREGSKPRKLAIEVNADETFNNEQVKTFTNGVSEFAVSADEKFFAFVLNGKLFRSPVTGTTSKPVQMTTGGAMDHSPRWAPDGSRIVFLSDRDGYENIYVLEPNDPEHPKLVEAHQFKVTQLTTTKEPESGLSFSPDGKKIAFLRDGKLFTMNPDGKELKEVVKDVQVFDYDWSPDSRWFIFARRDGSFASELYAVPATGATEKEPIRNLTRYSTFNGGVTWSQNGKQIAFLSERRGTGSLYVMDLEAPAAPLSGPKPAAQPFAPINWAARAPLAIDFEDIHQRITPLRAFADEAAISPDGTKVAYRDRTTNDLWVATSNGNSNLRLTMGGMNPRQIVWSKRRSVLGASPELIYFLDGAGNMRLVNAAGGDPKPGTDRAPAFPWKVRMTIKINDLHQEMFDQGWRYLSDHFYDNQYHGVNWAQVRERYRPVVKHVTHKEDLYALMYLMMGELNASHLGVSGSGPTPDEDTAELGILWDDSYRGKGLKIAEVLRRSPAGYKSLGLKPGDYVLAIDDVEITPNTNVAQLLNGKAGEAVVLLVTDNPEVPKAKRRRVEVMAIHRNRGSSGRPAMNELMYQRWVANNAAKVSELSKGKLGYIHIPSMDENGLDQFVRSLYSDNFDKDAIVIDVRFNGGGFMHDQVLNYLGSREHTLFKMRDGGTGIVLRSGDRKWTKPLALLINNRSYSDAEIFPNAFKTLGLGKVVGEATGGFVIGTSGLRLIDGSVFRIPRIGVYRMDGVNMDKQGVSPDILVEPHPDDLAKGIDRQLEKAVEVLRGDVVAWRKKRGLEATETGTETKTPNPTPTPMPTGTVPTPGK